MQALKADKWSYVPLLLALPVTLVVILASGGSWMAESQPFSAVNARAIRRTNALLVGITQRGTALGDPKAPVTLQFFGDLQCADSRRVMLGALPFLIRHWVRGGELRLVYRSTETDTLDASEFREEQIAALAAGRQEKMWTFIDLFYREQRAEFSHYADEAFLEGIAEQAGVDQWRWAEERESEGQVSKIETDEALARSKALPGHNTPSFLIGPTGGVARPLRHFSLEESRVFDEAIRELL